MSHSNDLTCMDCENQEKCPQWQQIQDVKQPCFCNEFSKHSTKEGKLSVWEDTKEEAIN